MRWAAPILAREKVARVADIGSGTLRNLAVQERHFEEITLVETPTRCEKLRADLQGKNHISLQTTKIFAQGDSLFDGIFFISVLHTIPDPKYRQSLVNLATRRLRPGGFIVVDVPQSETYYNRKRKELPRFKDGYLLSWGRYYTFYKSFYREELDRMFEKRGLELLMKIHYSKHLIRIWRKQK